MPVEIVTTLPDLAARFGEMAAKSEAIVPLATTAAAEAIKPVMDQTIRAHTPVGQNDTGEHLVDTTDTEVITLGAEAAVQTRQTKTVTSSAGTAYWLPDLLTMGTAPHVIRPATAGALFWEGADHPVASVNHPGTAPIPYLAEAATEWEPAALAILAATGHDAAASIIQVLGAKAL